MPQVDKKVHICSRLWAATGVQQLLALRLLFLHAGLAHSFATPDNIDTIMPAQLGKPANNDGSEEDLKAPATKNLQASPASSDVEQPQGHDHDREAYDHRHQHGTICLHGHGPVGGVKEFGTAKQKVSAHV